MYYMILHLIQKRYILCFILGLYMKDGQCLVATCQLSIQSSQKSGQSIGYKSLIIIYKHKFKPCAWSENTVYRPVKITLVVLKIFEL